MVIINIQLIPESATRTDSLLLYGKKYSEE